MGEGLLLLLLFYHPPPPSMVIVAAAAAPPPPSPPPPSVDGPSPLLPPVCVQINPLMIGKKPRYAYVNSLVHNGGLADSTSKVRSE